MGTNIGHLGLDFHAVRLCKRIVAPVCQRGMNFGVPAVLPLVLFRIDFATHGTVKVLGKLSRPPRSVTDAVRCCKKQQAVEHFSPFRVSPGACHPSDDGPALKFRRAARGRETWPSSSAHTPQRRLHPLASWGVWFWPTVLDGSRQTITKPGDNCEAFVQILRAARPDTAAGETGVASGAKRPGGFPARAQSR